MNWFLHKSFFILILLCITKGSFASTVITYQGQIDFIGNQFDLVFHLDEKSSLILKGSKVAEKEYSLFLDIDHFKMPMFDLSSKVKIEIEKKQDHFYGRIGSQYSLVDYKPIRELAASFEVKNKRLYISSLSVDRLAAKGYIDLAEPHALNIHFDLADIAMKDFLNFWTRGKKIEAGGDVSGNIQVSGTLGRLMLQGRLTSFNGFIKKLKYDSIYLNAEGYYPHLQIAHSTLSETKGLTLGLDGQFNLADTKNFKKQLKALTISSVVSESEKKSEWMIKRVKDTKESGVEMNYFLRKEKSLISSSEDQGGVLGIERKMEF